MNPRTQAQRIDRQRDKAACSGDVCGVNGTEWFQCQPWRCELARALELADQWRERVEVLEAVAAELQAEVVRLRIGARARQAGAGAILRAAADTGEQNGP